MRRNNSIRVLALCLLLVLSIGQPAFADIGSFYQPYETQHNLPNNYNQSYKIQFPGASKIRVHFVKIDMEQNYDYIYVQDGNAQANVTYTGVHDNIWTPWISGDTVYILATTDGSVNSWGYKLDSIEYETYEGNTINVTHYYESPRSLNNYQTDTYTITNNNTSAAHKTKMRVYFNAINVETNYDVVQIKDAQGRVLQTITGSHNGFYSNWIDGNSISISIVTDGSVASWGYTIGSYQVISKLSDPPPSVGTVFNPPTRLPVYRYYDRDTRTGYISDWTGWSGTSSITPHPYDGHKGVDYNDENVSDERGTPVYNTRADAYVEQVVQYQYENNSSGGWGTYVKLKNTGTDGKIYYQYYAHLKYLSPTVTSGQNLNSIQKIGEVGNTGNSSGPHLHFETRDINNQTIDLYYEGLIKPLYPNSALGPR